jgi:hypothetical protein
MRMVNAVLQVHQEVVEDVSGRIRPPLGAERRELVQRLYLEDVVGQRVLAREIVLTKVTMKERIGNRRDVSYNLSCLHWRFGGRFSPSEAPL